MSDDLYEDVSVPSASRFCGSCGAALMAGDAGCAACIQAEADALDPPVTTLAPDRPNFAMAIWLFGLLVASFLPFAILSEDDDIGLVFTLQNAVQIVDTLAVLTFAFVCWQSVWPLIRKGPLLWCLAAIPTGMVTMALATGLIELATVLVGIEEFLYSEMAFEAGYGWAFLILTIVVQPAIIEELAFRGIIFDGLRTALSDRGNRHRDGADVHGPALECPRLPAPADHGSGDGGASAQNRIALAVYRVTRDAQRDGDRLRILALLMIAEHEFVTTFEQEEALAAAVNILRQMGFKVRTYESRIVAKRGVDKPTQAKHESQLPRSIEMTFDRGRCNLAASVMLQTKTKPLHRDMVKTALTTLERVLVHGQTDEEALEDWRRVESRAKARTAQHGGARRVVLWVLIGFLCLLLLGCVIGMLMSVLD